jgi:hypothetical protein
MLSNYGSEFEKRVARAQPRNDGLLSNILIGY